MQKLTRPRHVRRKTAIAVSLALVIAIVLTGTFAFVLPFQHRSNEVGFGGLRYDATLNERFVPVDNARVNQSIQKQINATNTGDCDELFGGVFVRISLREFMEFYDVTYYYWEADGTTEVSQALMNGRAALFMTHSNYLGGNPSRVFAYVDLPETAAPAAVRTALQAKYPYLNISDTHQVVFTTDYISGTEGWFVISREGDLHGQYGRYMVARIDRDTANPTLVGSNTPRAVNADYGLHEPNGECDYDIHQWPGAVIAADDTLRGTLPAPTRNYREWVRWTVGADVILYSEWRGETGVWIIDDRAGEVDGWVYWSCELAVGETTANFLESFMLIQPTPGDSYYVIHTHMEAFSADDDEILPGDRPPTVWRPGTINIRNPAMNVIYSFSVEAIRTDSNGNPYYYLGNGFEIICRAGNGRFEDPVVIFGRYRQSFIGSGEMATDGTNALEDFAVEPLTWLLLDVDRSSGSALMITEYFHDNVLFNTSAAQGNAYETSNLRAFLNSDGGVCRRPTAPLATTDGFWNTAFTPAEQSRVLNTVRGAADDGPALWVNVNGVWQQNWISTNMPGNIPALVDDYVFALSNAETWRYFGPRRVDDMRTNSISSVSDFSLAKGTMAVGRWWTRSAGVVTDTLRGASFVDENGRVSANSLVTAGNGGPRPAITINIS